MHHPLVVHVLLFEDDATLEESGLTNGAVVHVLRATLAPRPLASVRMEPNPVE